MLTYPLNAKTKELLNHSMKILSCNRTQKKKILSQQLKLKFLNSEVMPKFCRITDTHQKNK